MNRQEPTGLRDGIPQVSYRNATGTLPCPLVNDYLFKALLQTDEAVLRGLVGSLLHLRQEEIASVEVRNPILLGRAIDGSQDSKIFVLDVNVLLNGTATMDLEMQVINHANWPERSLSYLCRSFDQLQRGKDYLEARPAVHIGLLDFTLFPGRPEFYATFMMMNVKSHEIYSDKFILSVVDLNHTELATQEDLDWEIDRWAALFKSTTWEELKMLTEKYQTLESAAQTIFELTSDETIRQECLAREKQVRLVNTVLRERDEAFQRLDDANQKLRQECLAREKQARLVNTVLRERDEAFQRLDDTNQKLRQECLAREKQARLVNTVLRERDEAFQRLDAVAQERDAIARELTRMQAELRRRGIHLDADS